MKKGNHLLMGAKKLKNPKEVTLRPHKIKDNWKGCNKELWEICDETLKPYITKVIL